MFEPSVHTHLTRLSRAEIALARSVQRAYKAKVYNLTPIKSVDKLFVLNVRFSTTISLYYVLNSHLCIPKLLLFAYTQALRHSFKQPTAKVESYAKNVFAEK